MSKRVTRKRYADWHEDNRVKHSVRVIGWMMCVSGAQLRGSGALVPQVFEPSPIGSVRSGSVAGALATTGAGIEAIYANPAHIGGRREHAAGENWTREVYFPYVSLLANEEAAKTYRASQDSGAVSPRTVGEALVAASEGRRHYLRQSVAFALTWSRLAVMPYYDRQMSATAYPEAAGGGEIAVRHEEHVGVAGGVSAITPDDAFALGVSGSVAQKKQVCGDFTLEQLVDIPLRRQQFGAAETRGSVKTMHVGAVWQWGPKLPVRLAMVQRHLAGVGSGDTPSPDLTLAVSAHPRLRRGQHVWLSFQTQSLTQKNLPVVKKWVLAAEWSGGGVGRDATWALRSGVNSAGVSGGMLLHLGTLELEVGVESRDVGLAQVILPERRMLIAAALRLP